MGCGRRHARAFDILVDQAPDWQPAIPAADKADQKARAEADEQKLIDDLARLSRLDYEQRRSQSGARTWESEVARSTGKWRRVVPGKRRKPGRRRCLVIGWSSRGPKQVDTDALLLSLKRRVQRHVILSNEAATVVALWILFAWVHDTAAVHSPILLVTSPEANCGKTTLLSIIAFLVPRALLCVEISEATLFRGIELWQPTIIVDEADVILVNNEPLRAVFNSGWTRGAVVPRCIGDERTPHAFPTFCPKSARHEGAQAAGHDIVSMHHIELKRKPRMRKSSISGSIDDPGLEELRRQALRWSTDNAEALKGAEPEMPPGFDNRLGDNYRLLLAIADLAGGEWPEQAREAAQTAFRPAGNTVCRHPVAGRHTSSFDEAGADAIGSADLVGKLTAEPDSKWAEWRSGKPITQNQLARLLKPFGIAPGQVWITADRQSRGYRRLAVRGCMGKIPLKIPF